MSSLQNTLFFLLLLLLIFLLTGANLDLAVVQGGRTRFPAGAGGRGHTAALGQSGGQGSRGPVQTSEWGQWERKSWHTGMGN